MTRGELVRLPFRLLYSIDLIPIGSASSRWEGVLGLLGLMKFIFDTLIVFNIIVFLLSQGGTFVDNSSKLSTLVHSLSSNSVINTRFQASPYPSPMRSARWS